MDDNTSTYSSGLSGADFEVPAEVIDDLPILVSYVDRDMVYRFVNRAYGEWLGLTRDQLIGRSVREVVGERAFAYALPQIKAALAGETLTFETMARYRDGDMRHMKAVYRPRRDGAGAVVGFHAVVEDLTHKRQAEDIITTALDGMADGYLTLDSQWRIQHFNAAAERIYDLVRSEVIGRHVDDIWPGATESPTGQLITKAFETNRPQRGEFDATRPPMRSYIVFVLPLNAGGVGLLFEDVSERKEAERHRELLIGELNHRVKNTLAIVQAITRQSLASSAVELRARDAIEGRIMALSAAHNSLTRGGWETVDLGELVTNALQPFRSREVGRIAVDGPEVRLEAKSAVAVSLAIHELATNAVKYGALSAPDGCVDVRWSVRDDAALLLRWAESGGPVVEKPARKGFGSRLIAALAHDLGGELNVDYAATGVTCEINASLPKRVSPAT